jgi:tetratricopeptide (TPR) repeat protein
VSRRLSIALFILGVLVLVPAVALFTNQGPFERTPPGAQALYWQEALGTAPQAGAAPQTRPPYARLLHPLASSELGAVHRARTLQSAVFLLLFAVAAFLLARPRIGPWAVVGGLATILLGPLAISAHNFNPGLPAAALLLAALVVLDRGRHWAAWAAAGALVAVAAWFSAWLAWSVALLVILRAVLTGTARERTLTAGSFLAAAAAASIVISLAAPPQPRIPTVSGVEVYRGHRGPASGVSPRRGDPDIRAWWTFADYGREASRVKSRRMAPPEAERYWLGKALQEMVRHPLAELRRSGVKLLAAYQGDPLPHDVGAAFLRDRSDSPMLGILVWAGRLLIPLGLWGLLWRRKRAGWVLGAAAFSGLVAFLLTFAAPPGRLVALVACGAGVGFWLQGMVRGPSRWKGVAGALAALAVWSALPPHGGVPGLGIQGDDYFYLGTVYDREQRGSAAIREYERALRLDPANPSPHLAIASMLARDNVNEEASRELEELRARYPDYGPVLFSLAYLYQAQERWGDAANVYGDLIRLEPWNPEHLNNLGTAYVQMGFYDQAVRAMKQALELDPGYRAATQNLAKLRASGILTTEDADAQTDPYPRTQRTILELIKSGNMAAAADTLEAAYATYGREKWELQFLDATMRLLDGEFERAVAIYRTLRERTPNNPILLVNLAAAYEKLDRLEDAKEAYETARRLQPTNERVRAGLAAVQARIDSLKNASR